MNQVNKNHLKSSIKKQAGFFSCPNQALEILLWS